MKFMQITKAKESGEHHAVDVALNSDGVWYIPKGAGVCLEVVNRDNINAPIGLVVCVEEIHNGDETKLVFEWTPPNF